MMRRPAIASLAMFAALALVPAGAHAGHTAFEQVSQGATGGNATLPTQFLASSADGTRVVLRTEEQLTASDTDTTFDLYERAGGVTTHLSVGPSGGNTASVLPHFGGISADGRRIFFETAENLVPGDTDDCDPDSPGPNPCTDVYEGSGGTTTLISTAPGANAANAAKFAGASEDGLRVFFQTDESLSAADTDSEIDLYERAGGTTTLMSRGPAGGNGSFTADFSGASADGARVFFYTSEQLTTQDTDTGPDVYERVNGSTALVSTGPAGGNSGAAAAFEGVSRDGSRAFVSTTEQLTSQDTDSSWDVYERAGGATVLVSTGPAGGNGSFDATFKVASEGGARVLFETGEGLVSSDTDSAIDVYERTGGSTVLLSTGPAGGNGTDDALFQGASSDATRVVVGTAESLDASDTDSLLDLYERANGTTTLVSTAPAGGNGAFEAYFSGMSGDGRRVFFETLEPLASDNDFLPDVYEYSNGATTRLSTGTGGGNGAYIAVFLGASDDGSRVFYNSAEVLADTDDDTASDVYVARTVAAYARPKGATPMLVPLVIAYRDCTAPNRMHGPPALGGMASNPSCAPPVQASDHLTVGTFDANAKAVQSTGRVEVSVLVGNASTSTDEADVALRLNMNDVRLRGSLADYAGELKVSIGVRITDRLNGSVTVDPATVVEMPFEFIANCVATSDANSGGVCAVDTTADAVVPGAITEGVRASWELDTVQVYDGGSDGVASTSGNGLFAVQGIFVP
jgi:hypothetical protein